MITLSSNGAQVNEEEWANCIHQCSKTKTTPSNDDPRKCELRSRHCRLIGGMDAPNYRSAHARTRRSGVWASAAAVNEGKILSALSTEDAAIKGSLFEK